MKLELSQEEMEKIIALDWESQSFAPPVYSAKLLSINLVISADLFVFNNEKMQLNGHNHAHIFQSIQKKRMAQSMDRLKNLLNDANKGLD